MNRYKSNIQKHFILSNNNKYLPKEVCSKKMKPSQCKFQFKAISKYVHQTEEDAGKCKFCLSVRARRRTLAFFGNFGSEIQTWESTSFGAKLGLKTWESTSVH